MNRKVVLFGFSITAMGFVAALSASTGCSSSPAPSNGKGSSSGSGSGSSSGGAGASCPQGATLIDDMTGLHTTGMGVPGGYWFTYDDRTNSYSEPPELLMVDGGTLPGSINPAEGAQFPPTTDAKLMIPAGLPGARECSGGGNATWGAGFGYDVADTKPDGGNHIPYWACDGGAPGQPSAGGPDIFSDAPDAGTGVPTEYDASAHKGVSFWAVSLNGNPIPVQVKFSEHRTNAWGGVCDPCATTLYNKNLQCGDDYLIVKEFPTTWQQFTIHWTDLATANWSKTNLPMGGFDAKHWVSMHFQFHANAANPLLPYDVAVACVQFVDN